MPMQSLREIILCGLCGGDIIGPYTYLWKWGQRNHYDQWGCLSDHDYRFIFVPAVLGIDVNDVWFQQDGANCHRWHVIIDLLRQTFEDRLISRKGDINWQPRSCDLTPSNQKQLNIWRSTFVIPLSRYDPKTKF